jgi:hypothetical protein
MMTLNLEHVFFNIIITIIVRSNAIDDSNFATVNFLFSV